MHGCQSVGRRRGVVDEHLESNNSLGLFVLKRRRSLFNSDFKPRNFNTMEAWKRVIDPSSKTEEIFFENGDTLPTLFNVDSRGIKEGKKIGEGFWTVHEAEWLGRKVAVKKFGAESTFHNVSLTSKEVNHMLSLQHPNVLKLLGFYLTTQKDLVLDCTMIMELMDFDLEDYIGRGALSNDQVVYITAEVAKGMNHIHKKGCFHRDLKPKNILLKKSIVSRFHVDVKIADFGSSELMGAGDINRKSGTTGYKAPEQFDSVPKLFPDKVDVFGFGAMCFKILTGKALYEGHTDVRDIIEQLDKATISQRNLPEDVVEIIWKCLDVNPESRPNFEEISCILDCALSAIWEKMPRPLAPSTSASLHSKDSMSKGIQGGGCLGSIFHSWGISKEYGVYFIPFEEILVTRLLGQGSVGTVYSVEWKGILYAQKVFLGSGNMDKNYFQIFSKLVHKNIVTFMGYCITPNEELSIIMEVQEMDLHMALVLRLPNLSIQKRWRIVREIAEGMKYLHDQGVGHGDLKPHNVVVSALDTNEMVVKLIDFANLPWFCTTIYAAPEVLMNRRDLTVDAKKADVYSFGILCHEIVGGSNQRMQALDGAQSFSIDESPIKFKNAIIRGQRPVIPIGTSPEMEHLITSCWNGDPQGRPNFSEICERLSQIVHYPSCQGQTYPKHLEQSKCCLL